MMMLNVDEVRVGGYQILTLLLLSVNLVIVAMSHALTIFYKYTPKFHCQDDVINSTTSGCPSTSCITGFTFDETERSSVATEWQLVCDREPLLRVAGDVYYVGMLLGAIVAGLLMDRIGRMAVMAICLYAQGTMAVGLNIVKHYELFLVFRGLQGFFIQGLESSSYILGIELFPSKYRALIATIILAMRSIGLAALSGLSYVILDWRMLQLVISVPTALTVFYIWLIPESARWLLARERTIDAELVIEKIANYNNLCWAKRGKEVPEKPKRKTRANNDECDVEKSHEEAENLLEETVNVEVKAAEEVMNAQGKSGIPTDLDVDEIAKTDEITTLDEKNEADRSYVLVSNEELDEDVEQKVEGKGKSYSLARFFETRFIGWTCLLLMCLWFASSVAFHGLINLPHRLSLDRHVSLAIAAVMELITFLITYLVISSRCGRRIPLCVGQVLAGLACVAIAILALTLPQKDSTDYDRWFARGKVAIVTAGRVTNVACFYILRVVTIELFPTVSRGTGLGLCIAAEMFGGLLSPLISMINHYFNESSRIAIGLFCICIAFLTLILSETLRMSSLPDSVEDAQMLAQKNKNEATDNPEKLRAKLFSEDWVDAGNGIIVNFTENKTAEQHD